MRVCARLSPRAPSAPSAWEPGHPAAASALGAQTLAPALRNVLLGGRAGSRRGQGVFIHHEPAVRKGLRTPHDEGNCWGLRASPRATDPWVMTQRIKQIPQGRADPSKYTRGRRDALPAGARKCVQWGGVSPHSEVWAHSDFLPEHGAEGTKEPLSRGDSDSTSASEKVSLTTTRPQTVSAPPPAPPKVPAGRPSQDRGHRPAGSRTTPVQVVSEVRGAPRPLSPVTAMWLPTSLTPPMRLPTPSKSSGPQGSVDSRGPRV